MAEPMTADQANTVYDILVEHCAAAEWKRDDFVFMHTHGRCDEFRFIGELGFGGKFWRHEWRVSAYREDMTAERQQMIDATNAALAGLKAAEVRR